MSKRWPFFSLRLCTFSLSGLLAACGGGGSDEAPQATVAISLTQPSAEEVFDLNATLTVSARVTVGGVDANDGTAVSFATSSGAFAAPAPVTRGGVATASLRNAAAGRQLLSASVTLSGQSATATRTVYLRQTPAPLEILVPAYFYPSAGSAWNALTAGAAAHPSLKVSAIMNPNNGEFSSADANFVRAATQFVGAGGHVLGYVYTRYGTGSRSLASVKTNIDNYLALYGRGLISGIFLDEMGATAPRLEFYREIYRYIKNKDPSLRVIGNPGLIPVAEYASVVDAMVTFEGKGAAYQDYDPRVARPWLYTRANSTQGALVHNVANCAAMQTAVKAAASARSNAGLVYMTDLVYDAVTGTGNPWAALPSYWPSLLQTVDAVNSGKALPSC